MNISVYYYFELCNDDQANGCAINGNREEIYQNKRIKYIPFNAVMNDYSVSIIKNYLTFCFSLVFY